ncbi:MAG: hypothetical protein WCW27_01740 [Patescibacteria group bacterium]|jgi:hypothetical protein
MGEPKELRKIIDRDSKPFVADDDVSKTDELPTALMDDSAAAREALKDQDLDGHGTTDIAYHVTDDGRVGTEQEVVVAQELLEKEDKQYIEQLNVDLNIYIDKAGQRLRQNDTKGIRKEITDRMLSITKHINALTANTERQAAFEKVLHRYEAVVTAIDLIQKISNERNFQYNKLEALAEQYKSEHCSVQTEVNTDSNYEPSGLELFVRININANDGKDQLGCYISSSTSDRTDLTLVYYVDITQKQNTEPLSEEEIVNLHEILG